ncbi:MAG: hypothetical protein ACTSRC_17300 [Candidatus Helarchaeota archaeon]
MAIAFYVLTSSGILLYSQQVVFEEPSLARPNPLLVAGFFSAIELFAKEYANQSIDIIEMGDYKLRFSSSDDYNCIFCLVHRKKSDEEKFKYLLNVLKSLFIFEFASYLQKKSRNISPYKKFDPLFERIFHAFDINKSANQIKIEHFTCGYLGEFRDFQHKSGFQCPNCHNLLCQQGVDYQILTS